MSNWFYYNEKGEKIAVTGGQLKGLAKAGLITPDTIVETEEGKQAPARRVKGLTFSETVQSIPTLVKTPIEPKPLAQAPSNTVNPFTAPVPAEVNPFVAPRPVQPRPTPVPMAQSSSQEMVSGYDYERIAKARRLVTVSARLVFVAIIIFLTVDWVVLGYVGDGILGMILALGVLGMMLGVIIFENICVVRLGKLTHCEGGTIVLLIIWAISLPFLFLCRVFMEVPLISVLFVLLWIIVPFRVGSYADKILQQANGQEHIST